MTNDTRRLIDDTRRLVDILNRLETMRLELGSLQAAIKRLLRKKTEIFEGRKFDGRTARTGISDRKTVPMRPKH